MSVCVCVCDVRREHDVLIVQSDENDTNIIYIIYYIAFLFKFSHCLYLYGTRSRA